jgi:ATP-dependent Clp protease adapter protein ClpS
MTATLTEKRRVRTTGTGGGCQVILYNDDVHTMEFVIDCLMRIFGHPHAVAHKVMVEAHQRGRAIAEVESQPQATEHCEQLRAAGLKADVETL